MRIFEPIEEDPKSIVDVAGFNFDSTASHIQWNPKARWYSMSECVNIKEAAGYLLGSTARHATKMLHTPRMRRALCCQQFNGAGSLLYFPKEAVVANKRKMPVS